MEFGIGSVPVVKVAEIYGKDANWVRAGRVAAYRNRYEKRKRDYIDQGHGL